MSSRAERILNQVHEACLTAHKTIRNETEIYLSELCSLTCTQPGLERSQQKFLSVASAFPHRIWSRKRRVDLNKRGITLLHFFNRFRNSVFQNRHLSHFKSPAKSSSTVGIPSPDSLCGKNPFKEVPFGTIAAEKALNSGTERFAVNVISRMEPDVYNGVQFEPKAIFFNRPRSSVGSIGRNKSVCVARSRASKSTGVCALNATDSFGTKAKSGGRFTTLHLQERPHHV